MRVAVTGGRGLKNRELIYAVLTEIHTDDTKPWLKCCKCPTKTLQDFIDD